MRVLTAAEMRLADRATVEAGLPDAILMENAGHRVVELLAERFAPLSGQRIVVVCGRGNNGGDGLVVARQLFTRFRPQSLDVLLAAEPPANLGTWLACGGRIASALAPEMRAATLVIDALLGTGLSGAPREPYLSWIDTINRGFPGARIVAVDIPSGVASDQADTPWPHVRADHTVTFTAPKPALVLEPNASACGEVRVGAIGTPPELCRSQLALAEPEDFADLFAPRAATAHKGDFGHVLVIGGAPGKTGAASMAGLAALRAGAGLVTVASSAASHSSPELMIERLLIDDAGRLDADGAARFATGKSVLAVGPGLGVAEDRAAMLRTLLARPAQPVVLDADALNNLTPGMLPQRANVILTPHPGEMSRLCGLSTRDVQSGRIAVARDFASRHGVTLVLKGRNTLTAFEDGEVVVNPTGGPALATGGSGDILTGLIAGLVAQFPSRLATAVVAAVWLHGRAGDLAAAELGEKCVIATDLLRFLPGAMEECVRLHHRV